MLRVHCVVPELRSGTGLEEARSHLTPKSFGGHSEGEIPGSIPNPEVKPFSADGTATGRLWESRTSPDITSVEATRWGGLYAFVGAWLPPRASRPSTRQEIPTMADGQRGRGGNGDQGSGGS